MVVALGEEVVDEEVVSEVEDEEGEVVLEVEDEEGAVVSEEGVEAASEVRPCLHLVCIDEFMA